MSRANHNWKRRAKLIEKHTGQAYNPGPTYGKRLGAGGRSNDGGFKGQAKGGKGKSKGGHGVDKAHGTESGSYSHSWNENWSAGAEWDPKQNKTRVRESSSLERKPRTGKAGSKELDAGVGDTLNKKRKVGKKAVAGLEEGKVFKKRKIIQSDVGHDKSQELGAGNGEALDKKSKVGKKTVANMKWLMNATFVPPHVRASVERPKKLTRMQMRKAWTLARKRIRHEAHVVCPGSISDRFVRGGQAHAAIFVPLDSYERRLLATGTLSWRWLREEFDYDDLPKQRPVVHESDPRAHTYTLRQSASKLSESAREQLHRFDHFLGVDALWPQCPARVELAAKMRVRKDLHRRCVRYFEDIVSPLLVSADATAGASASAPLLAEARSLCMRCAEAWQQSRGQAAQVPLDAAGLRLVWLQMLRRSVTEEDALLQTLRACLLARLCPQLTAEALQAMLGRVVTLAADAAADRSKKADDLAVSHAMVMLPLGVFTPWQVLLLVAIARWLGSHATVVRRAASGNASVFFRSTDSSAA